VLALAAVATAAAACDDADADPTPGAEPTYAMKVEDAPIDDLEILILESFPPQYNLLVTSGLPSGCAVFDKAEIVRRAANEITVRVTNLMPDGDDIMCTAIYGIKETTVPLGSDFESGQKYTVRVNDKSIDFTAQ
jgi:inhibitor of cysteine peptidase